MKKLAQKVAILGKLETKFYAPFDNHNFDIWAFNYHKTMPKRYTAWFDLHLRNPNPIATVTRKNYPFEEINKMLGGNYINNSASYLLAYAIYLGYKEIHLYGMRFNSGEEIRTKQRQNLREIIFFAKGKGIKISAPYDDCLLSDYPVYGL